MVLSDPTLFETPHGRVAHCADCGRFEITFLGERLRVPPSDFCAIAQTVECAWHDIQAAPQSGSQWRLAAQTAAGSVTVTFDADELTALHNLLHGTQAMLELDAMLQDILQA